MAERLAERLIGAAWPAAVALAVVGGALWRDAAPLASVILASAAGLTLLGVWDRLRAQRLAARVLQDRPGSATGAVARLVERLAALDHRTAQLHLSLIHI